MPDTFAVTIIFIALATFIAAFIRRKKKDKCLKNFSNNMVTLESTSGKTIWGRLRVENTGMELIYPEKYQDEKGHDETSYIMYKSEFSNILTLIRYHDQLSESARKKRDSDLNKTYHPTYLRSLKRKTYNVFKTVRDSIMEVVNLLMARAQKATPAGAILASQDKYVSQIKTELIQSVGTSFEPMLERYIGCKVVLEMVKADKVIELPGILKEYTADFIEIMDVNYSTAEDAAPKKADLVVPRTVGLVRHLAE